MTDSSPPDTALFPQPGPPPAAPSGAPYGPPQPPVGRPRGWDRFFGWLEGLGLLRIDGWIGGVCAGIAARLGIDPIIVRGVFVVAAFFGLPMFLVYGLAWALLPDLEGRIHLRELTRRRFDPAMVGIGLMLLVGLFPVVPWFFAAVLPYGLVPGLWPEWSPWGLFSTILTVVVIGGVIFLLARIYPTRASSSGAPSPSDPRTASADPTRPGGIALDDSGVGAPADPAAEGVDASGPAGSAFLPSNPAPAASPAPPAEPAVPAGATDAEMADWREQHAAWKQHDHAWRRQQQDAERAARLQARLERAASAGVVAAEAAERRRVQRAANPRTSASYVVFVVGAALVAGAVTSLWRGAVEPAESVVAAAFGVFAAALVVAIAMIVAGALRRRSGFLAFVTVALLVAGAITAAFPLTRGLAFGDQSIGSWNPQSFTQVWGHLSVGVDALSPEADDATMRIEKLAGSTDIWVGENTILTLRVTSPDSVQYSTFGGPNSETGASGSWNGVEVDDGRRFVSRQIDNSSSDSAVPPSRQTLVLDQQSGSVSVLISQP